MESQPTADSNLSILCICALFFEVGSALMAVWSKAMPLTASCLSPLSESESHPGHVSHLGPPPVTSG